MLRSAWESSHTLSFTAALAIHTLKYFSWKHAYPRSMFCVIPPTLAVAIIFQHILAPLLPFQARRNKMLSFRTSCLTRSDHLGRQTVFELHLIADNIPPGVHAMNNVVLTKWCEQWFECYDHDTWIVSAEPSNLCCFFFVCVWIFVIASTVIELAWFKAILSSKGNVPVSPGSTR